MASADLLPQIAGLQSLWDRFVKLLVAIDGRQPEAEGSGIVIAGAPIVTIDERRRPERLQTGSG